MSIRTEKQTQKRRRIVEAAHELFHAHGFEGATTRTIAERAGIAHGTLFRYAPTKVDLLLMLYLDGLVDALDRGLTRTSPSDPILEQFEAIYSEFFALYAPNPVLSARFVHETLFVQGARGEEYEHLNATFLTQMVARTLLARDRGEIRADIAPDEVVRLTFAVYAHVLYEWIRHPSTGLDPALMRLRRLLQLLGTGIAPIP
jgi:AcrR family transcriptional regulator